MFRLAPSLTCENANIAKFVNISFLRQVALQTLQGTFRHGIVNLQGKFYRYFSKVPAGAKVPDSTAIVLYHFNDV